MIKSIVGNLIVNDLTYLTQPLQYGLYGNNFRQPHINLYSNFIPFSARLLTNRVHSFQISFVPKIQQHFQGILSTLHFYKMYIFRSLFFNHIIYIKYTSERVCSMILYIKESLFNDISCPNFELIYQFLLTKFSSERVCSLNHV